MVPNFDTDELFGRQICLSANLYCILITHIIRYTYKHTHTDSYYWSWIKESQSWKGPKFMLHNPSISKAQPFHTTTANNNNHNISVILSICYSCDVHQAVVSTKAGTRYLIPAVSLLPNWVPPHSRLVLNHSWCTKKWHVLGSVSDTSHTLSHWTVKARAVW